MKLKSFAPCSTPPLLSDGISDTINASPTFMTAMIDIICDKSGLIIEIL